MDTENPGQPPTEFPAPDLAETDSDKRVKWARLRAILAANPPEPWQQGDDDLCEDIDPEGHIIDTTGHRVED
jgi:hypothetical protein